MSKKSKKCLKIRESGREEERVAVRSLGGEDLGSLAIDKFVELVQQ
jgi:hypothetical protein